MRQRKSRREAKEVEPRITRVGTDKKMCWEMWKSAWLVGWRFYARVENPCHEGASAEEDEFVGVEEDSAGGSGADNGTSFD